MAKGRETLVAGRLVRNLCKPNEEVWNQAVTAGMEWEGQILSEGVSLTGSGD